MDIGEPTRPKLLFIALLSFALAGGMFYSWVSFEGIPPRSALQETSGRVAWVQDGRYGIHFGLEGNAKAFNYASKSNAMGVVLDVLSQTPHPIVSIRYEPTDPGGPVYSNEVFYDVFELSAQGKMIRSHAEVAEAWRSDQQVAVWLAGCFVLSGLVLAAYAFGLPKPGRG